MESIFTKEQRHAIYKQALSLHYKMLDRTSHCIIITEGMCTTIHEACVETLKESHPVALNEYLDLYVDVNASGMMEHFPEFIEIRPDDYRTFWWSIKDRTIRIEKFKEIIEASKS